MTAPSVAIEAPTRIVALAATASGTTILLMRPLVATRIGWTVPIVVGLFATVLALGIAVPAASRFAGARTASISLACGMAIFLAGRLIGAGHPPAQTTTTFVALNTLAAIAEEALYRRTAYAALLPIGPAVAILGPAALFGLAHATVYGLWVLPLDFAAGLVFGWQRWVSGTWTVPAITHALADLLVVI